ncbi:substrate-binding domain-containing protein [Paracoccus sp. NGMCC 1.201697]|uniref:Substrate-binding domain-containing protein n=1 Tax=Paracoccus broussonetiae subsp. drimophilus TaxID=3373869 RepID=A0ABW7LLI6_9RHOB
MKRLIATTALCLIAGSALAETRIGVSMTSFDNPFLTVVLNGIRAEAERSEGVTLSVEDAQLDVAKQLNQVQNFVANGVDAIIVNAVDGDSTAAITAAATGAGIPLVYVNHPPAELDTGMPAGTAYVGSQETDAGKLQADAVCALLKGRSDPKAVILMGPLENHAALVRTKMVEDAFAQPDCKVEVIEKQTAGWNRVQAQDLMGQWLTAGLQFDAVVSNNDEMAIGAAQALQAATGKGDIIIAGIDATADGLAAMQSGQMDVTVFQDATGQGEDAVKAAVAATSGGALQPETWIPFQPVTKENMAEYLK